VIRLVGDSTAASSCLRASAAASPRALDRGSSLSSRETVTTLARDAIPPGVGLAVLVVLARLLADPGSAARISSGAVERYAITADAASRMARM
jgi:hypothetical protein